MLAKLNQITQIKFTNLTSKAERLCWFKFDPNLYKSADENIKIPLKAAKTG